jgi:hypothetical protein
MTQRNGVAPHEDFFQQQSQNLLPHGDFEHLRADPQFAAKPRQVLCQL